VAASLRQRGVEVGAEPVPLERALGAGIGALVREAHERRGVRLHLGVAATAIGDEVVLADGSRLPADLVVLATGVRPNLTLAEQAGLRVDRGILVDQELRTSATDVWAAGDVARWPDPHTGALQRVEHWVLAQRQGRTAARNVLGRGERFDAVPFFWTAQFDLAVCRVGFDGADRVDAIAPGRAWAFRRGDRTLAVATVGDDRLCLEAELLLERDDQAALSAFTAA
jgi:NADPH-dependent 2,4-dienoyl-CoA reductase/sulfur reductase-like enzyme